MVILLGEPELSGCLLDSSSPFVPDLCILKIKTFHVSLTPIQHEQEKEWWGVERSGGKVWSSSVIP